jgi:hypothetical protein
MSKNFYLDVGSILDARAGTIRRLNPEAYAEAIRTNYHQRKGDFFKGIDPQAFRKLYKSYEMETIMEGTVTNVFQFLYPQITDALKEFIAHEGADHMRPMVDVNVWPYDFSEEQMAYLRTLVYRKLKGLIGVNVFKKDIKDLTPAHCSENYFMMIMYDYDDYLNVHSTELIKNPQPMLILVAPMVYFNRDPDTDEETIDQLKQGTNSLALLEALMAPRISLRFVNVDIFSIVYPDDRIIKADLPDTDRHISIDELDKVLLKQKEKRIPEA